MIVGRSAECRELLRLRDSAESGRGAARVVVGAPGSGKSALLGWIAEHRGTARVVRVESFEHDRRRAFSLLGAVVSSLSAELSMMTTEQGDVLRAVLSGTPAGGAEFGLGAALVSLLAAAARTRPLVLLVDGAHWTDAASREVLVFAAQHIDREAVLVLIAERDCDPNGFAARLPTLELAGLSPLDAALLLASDVDTRVAEELGRETAGNPHALLEIAAHLSPEQRRGEIPLDLPLPVGEVLRRGFLARTVSFGPSESRALLIASTDSRLDRETLIRAARGWGIDAAAVDRTLVPGLLCSERSGTIRFAHPLLRATVYQSADADDRRTAHRMVAAALGDDADINRRARHLSAAADGPDALAADALALAAQGRSDDAAAGEIWHRAALLSPDAASRYERMVDAGKAFARAGESLRAVHAFDDALVGVDDVSRRSDVTILRAMPAVESMGTRGVREQLGELIAKVESSDPRAHVMVALSGAIAMLQGDFVGARDVLRSESGSAPGPTRTMLDVARLLTGEITEIGDVVAYAEQLAAARDPQFRNDEFVVFALTWAGEHSTASRLVDPLVMTRRISGASVELAFALSARAYLYLRTGQWRAARVDAFESVELATEACRPTTLARSLFVLARIEAGLGDTEMAIEHARAACELGERFELGAFSWHASAAMGFALLGDSRPAEAIEWLERASEFARTRGVSLLTTSLSAPDLVEAYLRCGERGAAARLVDELASQRTDQQGALGHALFLRCRALVGGADAASDFEAALQRHTEVRAPFEEARTRLCFGEQVRRDRDVVAAHRNLTAAADAFSRLGARAWEQRARMEAAACKRGRAEAVSTLRLDSLTPQEYRVAIEVANGATSREAAASLFLSPRTVEYHLGKIYRKLGLRSRSDLVRRIAADPGFVAVADPRP
ncbi:MAG: AAA family ATPase [Acidimicrobiia bacterium]